MKIITQLVILTLSLLLVNAHDENEYCANLFKQYKTFKSKCSPANITIDNCCDLSDLPHSKAPSGIYQMKSCIAPCELSPFTTITTTGYCDMTTDGGGWIVIQRNKKNSLVNFNRNWTDYENGFGDLHTEFWYGLKSMHCLTQRGQWEMRVDYQLFNKTWSYLHYNQFSVGSASEEYPLTVGGYSGSISSTYALYYNRMKFSTADNDNDERGGNCAVSQKSGYWYKDCRYINLNEQPPFIYPYRSVFFAEMKIRPKNCIIQ